MKQKPRLHLWQALSQAALVMLPLAVPGTLAAAETAAQVPVETFELANGMKFLTVERPESPVVHAIWVAHVGSAHERPGATGISHFIEHLLFKGSHTIGTSDVEAELRIIREQEEIQRRIRADDRRQRHRFRRGEIDDPFADRHRTPERIALGKQFQALVEKQRELIVQSEYRNIYTAAGAPRVGASTGMDSTIYTATVPANKLELWFWMESDRVLHPMFREFYTELDVVREERREVVEATSKARLGELLNAMFWQSHPYSWPIVGWPSDLESISRAQVEEHFATYYVPNNLTAILVGRFDPEQVRTLAERYFGRLPRGQEPPDVVTLEIDQQAEKRMVGECDCQPGIDIRYHAVPFGHRDAAALVVLESLLLGPKGRAHQALVLEQRIASRIEGGLVPRKWAGAFHVEADPRGGTTPAELEQAWYRELRRFQQEPITADELRRVKTRAIANSYRDLRRPRVIALRLAYYQGMGDWTHLNRGAEKILAVEVEDVRRVAASYFSPNNRTVGWFHRKAAAVADGEGGGS